MGAEKLNAFVFPHLTHVFNHPELELSTTNGVKLVPRMFKKPASTALYAPLVENAAIPLMDQKVIVFFVWHNCVTPYPLPF